VARRMEFAIKNQVGLKITKSSPSLKSPRSVDRLRLGVDEMGSCWHQAVGMRRSAQRLRRQCTAILQSAGKHGESHIRLVSDYLRE